MSDQQMKSLIEHVCTQEKDISQLKVDVAAMKGELHNGIEARVKLIERMQWWQIGLIVAIIVGLVGGMWTMLRQGSATARENQRLLLDHVQQTERLRDAGNSAR